MQPPHFRLGEFMSFAIVDTIWGPASKRPIPNTFRPVGTCSLVRSDIWHSIKREVDTAMDEAEIYTRLSGIFLDVFDDESIDVKADLTANDVDGWDSLTHIRLMLTVEKTFKVKFSTAELGNLKSVGDLVALIKKRTQQDS